MAPADVVNDSANTFDEMKDTYTYLLKELVARKVGIITVSRRGHSLLGKGVNTSIPPLTRPDDCPLPPNYDPVLDFGPLVAYPGSPTKLMANEDYDIEEGELLVQEGKADLVGFGRSFVANPVRSFKCAYFSRVFWLILYRISWLELSLALPFPRTIAASKCSTGHTGALTRITTIGLRLVRVWSVHRLQLKHEIQEVYYNTK